MITQLDLRSSDDSDSPGIRHFKYCDREMPEPEINVSRLLQLVSRGDSPLDSRALGRLVALLSDEIYPRGPRAGALRLTERASLDELYLDPDFVESLGVQRIKSSRLARSAFARASSPSVAIARISGLANAGALNVFSSSFLECLHAGMQGWRIEVQSELVGRLAETLDTFSSAGLFLSLLLRAQGSALEPREVLALLRRVVARSDVRDLSGAPADLLDQLPKDVAGEVEDELLDREESDDSDADENGNLAGFVVESDDDDDEDDDDDDSAEEVTEESDASGDSGGRKSDAPSQIAFKNRATKPAEAETRGALFDALCELGVAAPSPRAPRPAKRRREAVEVPLSPAGLRRLRYQDTSARVGRRHGSDSE